MNKRLVVLVAVLVAALVGITGTIAWLTDTGEVTNTFTVGNITMTMDESDVDNSSADKDRDTANTYHLLPGQQYVKDPQIHIGANSEACYVFIKVENGLANIEAASEQDGYKTIAEQIEENDWTALEGVSGVYYKTQAATTEIVDLDIFEQLKIGNVDSDTLADYAQSNIVVTAYAIQQAGFTDATSAYTAVTGVYAQNSNN